ncbi:uncharacterized protein MYCFIDRAFT_170549 [Pseudocercospora fijiensis CIRAD86]|uniref:Uncharacterized protein n=1 Tax=Pseudocercospora fijiensis (strain CIRAD86) TaxID=383855 RepID=N1Q850_PSEFD|nr:uncharacterized protein MYCFIDRAFT_170549 [Pseudocercospora fijiensis CIRAD86]EME89015.1 hypothetical protein MYCFIDRAFT_170549 [Pseudocercospora fijiensis CIRAD86]
MAAMSQFQDNDSLYRSQIIAAMVRNFKKWMPDLQPIWTCVGVTRLGEEDMRVELEVVTHNPERPQEL